jgi:hypothetical protein
MAAGEPFEEAFRRATGVAFRDESGDFWTSRRSLERWLPLLTSTAAVWLGIVLLAAWAVRAVRGRRAARVAAWAAEERAALQAEPLEAGPPGDRDDLGTEGNEDPKRPEGPPFVH